MQTTTEQTGEALTVGERNTLNAAMAIIERHTPPHAVWMFNAGRYTASKFYWDLTYFDSTEVQHSGVRGTSFAEKVRAAIEFEANAEKNAEAAKLARITRLQAELAQLTEQAA